MTYNLLSPPRIIYLSHIFAFILQIWLHPTGKRVLEGTYLKGKEIIKEIAKNLTIKLNNKRKAVEDIAANVYHALESNNAATEGRSKEIGRAGW